MWVVSSPTSDARHDSRKLRVLAVDDNEIHCYAMHKVLASAGFEVTSVHSGNEALQVIGKAQPDAILLDIGLGDMNGFEVCNMIRASSDYDQVAIVFHSASRHADASPRSTHGGADAFLTYPVDSEHLVSVVRGCIQRRRDAKQS